MGDPIKSVLIVGGGTAGWMTAAALSRYLPKERTKITLIESEDIGTVGVGEATIPQIATFNQMLGIKEEDFLKATSGTFKLGIEFADWGKVGDRYFHPFGEYGFDLEGVEFHHYWRRLAEAGHPTALNDYSLNALAAYDGKYINPGADPSPQSILRKLGYAYHFDASRYAAFLRTYAEQRGVRRQEGKVVHVDACQETQRITAVKLEDGSTLSADLYIDCTGFRGLLIEQALDAGYTDWSEWLPMNRAVAMPTSAIEDPRPYTVATARSAGWTWRIPLQHRVGNGYVYSDQYCSESEATDNLMSWVDGEPLADPRHLRFVTGHRNKFWSGNCIAIGLSAGFLEPLESTSIHLIQTGIAKLLALFPTQSFLQGEIDEYNRLMTTTITHIRDFIILHYVATERNDSPFWRFIQDMSPPASLTHKMSLMEEGGRFFRYDDELFSVTSWLAVMQGQGKGPRAYNPVAGILSHDNLSKSLENMRAVFQKTCTAMPSHMAYLKRHCWADEKAT